MKQALKHFFIPHEGNNYHPHILHTKRAIMYSGIFLATKFIVISFAVLLPLQVFVMPDVLQVQQEQIIALTNDMRARKGLPLLHDQTKLYVSSQMKADDMAAKQYFEHVGPDGKGLKDYMYAAQYDYRYAGENLAMGFSNAQELVYAWANSPTHYANLIDTDYNEFGVGLEVGEYNGVPTIYVAQHFGSPSITTSTQEANESPVTSTFVGEVASSKLDTSEIYVEASDVIHEKNIAQSNIHVNSPSIVYNKDVSRVFWREEDGRTVLTAKAYIVGDVVSAIVRVNQYSIELFPSEQPFVYHGEITVFDSSDNLFKVITTPTIAINGVKDVFTQDTILWNTVKVVAPTPMEKYTQAKTLLGGFTRIFDISRGIYLGFIIFFSIALALKIFIEFRKQHPHVILQTILLIGLLVILFEV